ncbi:MAG: hypothetical protein F4X58_07595 [Chloroflexi bacterium]|nr:hypothetical protein [Chloroflexota bacterium]MYC01771.1 hypothetical protein [Chloroflexota bacterium]
MSQRPSGTELRPGVALLPEDFPARLTTLKQLSGLSWEGMATAMGVDSRQLHRWRQGTAPNGEAMLSLVRLATQLPGGLDALLDEDRRRRS